MQFTLEHAVTPAVVTGARVFHEISGQGAAASTDARYPGSGTAVLTGVVHPGSWSRVGSAVTWTRNESKLRLDRLLTRAKQAGLTTKSA
jgi:hypothetical protein